jgi:hypothetical protein
LLTEKVTTDVSKVKAKSVCEVPTTPEMDSVSVGGGTPLALWSVGYCGFWHTMELVETHITLTQTPNDEPTPTVADGFRDPKLDPAIVTVGPRLLGEFETLCVRKLTVGASNVNTLLLVTTALEVATSLRPSPSP